MARFTLPELPYAIDALAPAISRETLEFHWGKHHQTYVNNLNNLVEGTDWAEKSLEDIILGAEGGLFNNAAQVYNHTFFWSSMTPQGGGEPKGALKDALVATWGSVEAFVKAFSDAAAGNFGSGWTWLVKDADGKLSILNTSNADTPIRHGLKPLLTIDVWEHAYYIDYRNARPSYLDHFWALVNWKFVAANLAA